MATGDLKRSLRNLEQVLRSLNYPREVDCVGLVKGDTAASLPIISYSLTSYSPYVAELLVDSNVELLAKNDLRFIDTVYKKKAVVIRHLYNEDGANIPEDTVTDVNEAFDVCDIKAAEITIPELQVPDINCEQQDIKVNPEVIALQSMLAECQEKLKKLTCIESRLESLEEKMKGKVLVNEKTWANLLSRVTLLETEMLLSKKNDEYVQFNEMSEDYSSSSDMDSLNPDRKSKEERHANIPLSSGYSTVSSDSTPRTSTVNYCGLKEISENLPTWSVPSSCSHPGRLRSRPPPASSSWTLPGPSPRLPLHFWDPMSPFPCCTRMF
ncbi:centrosomal protein of 44 kDa isoform X4 [Bubalus bubalis]|uniref:centrosomal protein of 44 kDa isoform X4 n=1 Tax=Bubalus bubalis TaxID=89462 RepID=UPI001E1B648C|nr:centrosomal protein of 44 kDa isoform X4 [Bubalus bubalis]